MGISLTIRKKLIFMLVCWIAILGAFGIYTRIKMNELMVISQVINDSPLTVSSSSKEILNNIFKIQRTMKDYLLSNVDSETDELKGNEELEKEVFEKLSLIKARTLLEENRKLEMDTNRLFVEWRKLHDEMIKLTQTGRRNEAIELTVSKSNELVFSMEENLIAIDNLARGKAASLVGEAAFIEKGLRDRLIYLLTGTAILFALLFMVIIKSIVGPINALTTAMDKSTVTGKLNEVILSGRDEITEIASYYNSLVNKLKNQFWIKDSQNNLNQELSGMHNIEALTQKTINFMARILGAGKGAFYLYNADEKQLFLNASFAFTEREHISNKYKLGEGIIGQVALEKMPIILKNISRKDSYVSTGLIQEAPTNVIAMPLSYEGQLYGVIELAFLEELTELKKEFLKEATGIISINLYSAIQGQKISDLLVEAEKAERLIREKADELLITNGILEEQQRLLQQQTEELQQTNAELEEQQQLLQQQSEELQNSNVQMEEQQQALEGQSLLLNNKNQELEQSRHELYDYSKQLEEANRYKSEFLANMSHELRTPLNSIILLSKLLMKNDTKLEQLDLEKLQVIYNSGNELLRLINEILDLSKIEAGKMDLHESGFHTKDLLKELEQLFKSLAEEKNISFEAEDSIDNLIIGDYDKISQILRNFISNAIKFTEKGSVKLKAELMDNKRVAFTVTDTGIGISKENLSIIFEEFQQGDGSISRKFGGTGLGLSISKKLADLLNAEISVSSSYGVGSSFQLRLDCNVNSLYNELDNRLVDAAASFEGSCISEDTISTKIKSEGDGNLYLTSKTNKDYALRLTGKKVLIVDDDPRNIFVLASALENYGAEIIEAENGAIALERLEEHTVDLVLIDIMMPIMDGFETIKAIRDNVELKELPIIAITAKSLKGDRESCIAAGANDYISKPVDYDTLIHLVKAWIERK